MIAEKDLSVDTLTRIILNSKSKVRTVEDVLCRLPKSFRSQYLLGFDSKSLQGSSYQNPRVIMYDNHNPPKLVLTFNGDPSQEGYNRIEVMSPAAPNSKGDIINLTDIEMGAAGGKPRVTTNPKECSTCHGSPDGGPLRPLFNAVPVWPGYYGIRGSNVVDIPQADVDKQNSEFQKFQTNAGSNSRYKYLIGLRSLSAVVDAKNDGAGFDPVKPPRDESMEDYLKAQRTMLPLKNRNFTIALARMNHPRIAALVKRSPDYQKYKYALLAIASNCIDNFADFIPPDRQASNINTSNLDRKYQGPITAQMMDLNDGKFSVYNITKQFKPVTSTEQMPPIESTLLKYSADTSKRRSFYGGETTATVYFRYLFESRPDPVDTKAWNIDPQQGGYRYNNNIQADFDFLEIMPALVKGDPELEDFVKSAKFGMSIPYETEFKGRTVVSSRFGYVPVNCSALKAKSLAALSSSPEMTKESSSMEASGMCEDCVAQGSRVESLKPLKEVSDRAALDVMRKNCSNCHESGLDQAPFMDFQHLSCVPNLRSKVKDRMDLGIDDKGHMPLLGSLSIDEQNIVQAYLRRLDESQTSADCSAAVPSRTGVQNIQTGREIASQVCNRCHNGRDDAPMGGIDFTSSSALSVVGDDACKRLDLPLNEGQHMPRYIQLTSSQLASLKAYFKSISPSINCPLKK